MAATESTGIYSLELVSMRSAGTALMLLGITSLRNPAALRVSALVPGAVVLGLALAAAEKRGWIRQSKKSGSTAYAVVEDLFSPSTAQARQVLQEQKRIGQRAPAPGDRLGDGPSVTGGFAGKLTAFVNRSPEVHGPDEHHIIAYRH